MTNFEDQTNFNTTHYASADFDEKITAEKERLAAEVAVELDELVTNLDRWLEMRIREEFEELREDVTTTNDALLAENTELKELVLKLKADVEYEQAINSTVTEEDLASGKFVIVTRKDGKVVRDADGKPIPRDRSK